MNPLQGFTLAAAYFQTPVNLARQQSSDFRTYVSEIVGRVSRGQSSRLMLKHPVIPSRRLGGVRMFTLQALRQNSRPVPPSQVCASKMATQ